VTERKEAMFDIDDVIQNDLDPDKMGGLIERCMTSIHGVDTPEAKWFRNLLAGMRDECELASGK